MARWCCRSLSFVAWIIENDWLEAIVALPTDMFYNTGIATYIWIITNKKTDVRKGKVQLINATELHSPMRKSLGSKRKQISDDQIQTISELFDSDLANDDERVKWFDNADFGYSRITVERPLKLNFQVSDERLPTLKAAKPFARLPESQQQAILSALATIGDDLYTNRASFLKTLKATFKAQGVDVKGAMLKTIWQSLSEKDETADLCTDSKDKPEPDADLRDNENVPLTEDIEAYFQREVIPHVPDCMDRPQ